MKQHISGIKIIYMYVYLSEGGDSILLKLLQAKLQDNYKDFWLAIIEKNCFPPGCAHA